MKIEIGTGTATGKELFKVVWRGWFIGTTAIFMPILLLAAITKILPNSDSSSYEVVLGILMVPLIAAMQGMLAGGLVLLGLKLRPVKEQSMGSE